MRSRLRRLLLINSVAAGLLVSVLPAPDASADPQPDELDRVVAALDHVEKILNDGTQLRAHHVVHALDGAALVLSHVKTPPRPGLLGSDPQSSTQAQKQVAEENKRRLREWARLKQAHTKRFEPVKRRWIRLLGLALGMAEPPHRSAGSGDRYAPVHKRALELCVASDRLDAALRVARSTSRLLGDNGLWHVPSPMATRLVWSLEALPKFERSEILDWFFTTFLGKGGHFGPIEEVVRGPNGITLNVVADPQVLALQAMAAHEVLPGRHRRSAVRDLIAAYENVEKRAAQQDPKQRLWFRVGPAAIDATWRLAGKPSDATGSPLRTMADLAIWFRTKGAASSEVWDE